MGGIQNRPVRALELRHRSTAQDAASKREPNWSAAAFPWSRWAPPQNASPARTGRPAPMSGTVPRNSGRKLWAGLHGEAWWGRGGSNPPPIGGGVVINATVRENVCWCRQRRMKNVTERLCPVGGGGQPHQVGEVSDQPWGWAALSRRMSRMGVARLLLSAMPPPRRTGGGISRSGPADVLGWRPPALVFCPRQS